MVLKMHAGDLNVLLFEMAHPYDVLQWMLINMEDSGLFIGFINKSSNK